MVPGRIPGKMSGMHRIHIVIVLAFFTLGSGPCDMFNPPDVPNMEGDASTDCTEMGCTDSLIVQIIRSDNMAFLPGSYAFRVRLPDASEYGIECYLAYTEAGLNCTMGDTNFIYAELGAAGQTIWIQVLYAPESLVLTIESNSFQIGQRTIWPVYEETFPNGDDCPPGCWEAEETMAVQSW